MPKMRLGWYAGASTALAGAVVFSAFQQRANFYSAMVYLSQSNFCLLVLINFTLLIYGTFVYGLSKLCWGTLRAAEVEQLTERAWFAITETCLAMTIFREELGAWFLVMFTSLVTGKVWGWIGDGRVEFLEQQPPANPRLFHTRLSISLVMSLAYDIWILRYCINTVVQEAKASMMVMFLFEFAVLATTSWRSVARYILSIIEQKMIQTQTQARLLERRQEVREQRETLIRQRQAAAVAGQTAENQEELPNPDDIDEMDIEVPGWATKGEWVLWLDLLTDTVKLLLYLAFFVLLTLSYTFPIHIMRDVLMTARDFLKRLNSVLRYRRAIQEMNRYPDATQEELDQENTCIICREDMRVWDLNANPGALDRTRPKKLPCGHILHLGCLKSWLERQQVCPTCRSPVTADRANVPAANQNINRAAALPQVPNQGPQAAQFGAGNDGRFGRFALDQPLRDPVANAGLNVDVFGRPIQAGPAPAPRPIGQNVRPMEEFHEMIRDEEQRRQEAEDRVRRRWRRVVQPEVPQQPLQPHTEPSQTQQSTQQPTSTSTTNVQSEATGTSQGSLQAQMAAQAPPAQLATNSQRAVPSAATMTAIPSLYRQQQLQLESNVRSLRLRTLSNLYSQASVLVRQEAESLRNSSEQLAVLEQLIQEFERLEAAGTAGSADGMATGNFGNGQTGEAPLQNSSATGPSLSRAIPTRTQSPAMMRHGATSYSASIPSGSSELPDGVTIPPGWTLMPLQRLDSQQQTPNAGTQSSSRAPSVGPASSPLGEERSQPPTSQPHTSQPPTSQPARTTRTTNVQVLHRIPGTNDFRLAGPDGAAPEGDDGPRISQQQLIDQLLRTGDLRFNGNALPSARPEASTARASATPTTASSARVQREQTHHDPDSNEAIPNWGGSSQLFGAGSRNETPAPEPEPPAAARKQTQPMTGNGESSTAASVSASTAAATSQDTPVGESSKPHSKAVTVEDVSDEEDD